MKGSHVRKMGPHAVKLCFILYLLYQMILCLLSWLSSLLLRLSRATFKLKKWNKLDFLKNSHEIWNDGPEWRHAPLWIIWECYFHMLELEYLISLLLWQWVLVSWWYRNLICTFTVSPVFQPPCYNVKSHGAGGAPP